MWQVGWVGGLLLQGLEGKQRRVREAEEQAWSRGGKGPFPRRAWPVASPKTLQPHSARASRLSGWAANGVCALPDPLFPQPEMSTPGSNLPGSSQTPDPHTVSLADLV